MSNARALPVCKMSCASEVRRDGTARDDDDEESEEDEDDEEDDDGSERN